MRKFHWIRKAFVPAVALSLFAAGCNPKPKQEQPKVAVVSVPAPVKVETPPPAMPDGGLPLTAANEAPKPVKEPVAEPKDEASSDELLSAARDCISDGEHERAVRIAQRAVDKAPNRSSAHNTLGRALLQNGDKAAAVEEFEKAVELNPASSWAQNNLGLALIYLGKYDDAIDALEEATAMDHVEPYMWNNLGMAYEHVDRIEEAREAYSKAVELKSERAPKNLARLEGVKSLVRTAKVDPSKLDKNPQPVELPRGEDSDGN